MRVDWRVTGTAVHMVSTLGNISGGGAMIMTTQPVPVGTEVDVRLLTDTYPVRTRGRVAWTSDEGMGVFLVED